MPQLTFIGDIVHVISSRFSGVRPAIVSGMYGSPNIDAPGVLRVSVVPFANVLEDSAQINPHNFAGVPFMPNLPAAKEYLSKIQAAHKAKEDPTELVWSIAYAFPRPE